MKCDAFEITIVANCNWYIYAYWSMFADIVFVLLFNIHFRRIEESELQELAQCTVQDAGGPGDQAIGYEAFLAATMRLDIAGMSVCTKSLPDNTLLRFVVHFVA